MKIFCAEDVNGAVIVARITREEVESRAPQAARITELELTAAQMVMVADGMPPELFRTVEQVRAARASWQESERKKSFEKDLQKKEGQSTSRLGEQSPTSPGDTDAALKPKQLAHHRALIQTKEIKMAKMKIQAFDSEKSLIVMACASIEDKLTPEQIAAEISATFAKANEVALVCLTGLGGTPAGAWTKDGAVMTRNDDLYFSAPMPKKPGTPKPESKAAPAAKAKSTAKKPVASKPEKPEREDSKMAKKSKAKANKAKAAKGAATKRVAAKAAANGGKKSNGVRGAKTEGVLNLLKRKTGCTREDILGLTGWPSVSVQAMAKAAGLKLKKTKEKGEATRYFGS